MDCPFELRTPTFAEPLRASRVKGRERVNGGYRFDVIAFSEGPADDPAALLDQPVHLALHLGAEPVRLVHGVAARVEVLGHALRERRALGLTIVPRADRVRLGRRRRVFQDATTLDIVTATLAPHEVVIQSRVVRPSRRTPIASSTMRATGSSRAGCSRKRASSSSSITPPRCLTR